MQMPLSLGHSPLGRALPVLGVPPPAGLNSLPRQQTVSPVTSDPPSQACPSGPRVGSLITPTGHRPAPASLLRIEVLGREVAQDPGPEPLQHPSEGLSLPLPPRLQRPLVDAGAALGLQLLCCPLWLTPPGTGSETWPGGRRQPWDTQLSSQAWVLCHLCLLSLPL